MVLRWVFFLVFLFGMAWTFQSLTVNGVTVLAAVALAGFFWTFGVFTREFWVGTPEVQAGLARVAEAIEAEERAA